MGQAAGVALALQSQGAGGGIPVVYNPGFGFVATAVVSLTAGTMFLMWLGEQVTERGVGNGISLTIFAGIVAGLPRAVISTLHRSEEHTSELQSLMRISYAVICLKKKKEK